MLWEMFPKHPNLLPAYFEDDPKAAMLGSSFVRKPLYSREGANVALVSALSGPGAAWLIPTAKGPLERPPPGSSELLPVVKREEPCSVNCPTSLWSSDRATSARASGMAVRERLSAFSLGRAKS